MWHHGLWPSRLLDFVASADGSYFLGEKDSQKQGEIIIMDKDTDVEQKCHWYLQARILRLEAGEA